jgi:hypothetical protein
MHEAIKDSVSVDRQTIEGFKELKTEMDRLALEEFLKTRW